MTAGHAEEKYGVKVNPETYEVEGVTGKREA